MLFRSNDRLKRDAFQAQQDAAKAERDRQSQVRQVFASGLPKDAQGNIDYAAASERLMALDPSQGVDFLKMGSQEADRRHNREFDQKKFDADQSFRQQQLGIQRENMTPADVREYQFYAGEEKKAGRQALPYNEWKRTAASTSYGKSGTIVQDANGNFFSVQFGSDGNQVVKPLAFPGATGNAVQPAAGAPDAQQPTTQPMPSVPLTPSRGVKEIDTGTGTQIIDGATGQPVREVKKDIAGAEAEKGRGKTQAEGEAALPKAASALRDYEIKNDLVNGEIDRAIQQAGPWTTGFVGNVGSWVAGSPAHDLSKTLMGIQSNLGFETLQTIRDNSPTGGALGSITERELELLQATWGSLVQSQSQEQFVHNLTRLKQIKAQFAVAKREAYERDVARFGAGRVPNPDAAPAPASRTFNWTPDGGLQEAQ